jgi:hypothetical protein
LRCMQSSFFCVYVALLLRWCIHYQAIISDPLQWGTGRVAWGQRHSAYVRRAAIILLAGPLGLSYRPSIERLPAQWGLLTNG